MPKQFTVCVNRMGTTYQKALRKMGEAEERTIMTDEAIHRYFN